MVSFEAGRIRAPELFGDFWFNGAPVSIRAMRGSVFLIDFWDYSSVQCIRTQPYVQEWHRRYRDFDLIVVGVHTPQFKFGRMPENVGKAIERAGIKYPVVMDNEGFIWASYGNVVWPTKFLVDKEGFLRHSHQGEGSYENFERALQSLLLERGYHGLMPELMEPIRATDFPGALCYRPTPEVRLGYLRGTIGNPEGQWPESTIEYADQGIHLPGRVYLTGKWNSEREFVRYDGSRREKGGIFLGYEAMEVHMAMDAPQRSRARVFALQDRQPLTKENAGADVTFDGEGRSYLLIDSPRSFNVVCNREFGQHELQLTTSSPGMSLYSFGFVTGVMPELISSN